MAHLQESSLLSLFLRKFHLDTSSKSSKKLKMQRLISVKTRKERQMDSRNIYRPEIQKKRMSLLQEPRKYPSQIQKLRSLLTRILAVRYLDLALSKTQCSKIFKHQDMSRHLSSTWKIRESKLRSTLAFLSLDNTHHLKNQCRASRQSLLRFKREVILGMNHLQRAFAETTLRGSKIYFQVLSVSKQLHLTSKATPQTLTNLLL